VSRPREDLAAARRRIEQVYYGPEVFQKLAETWTELLSGHLASCEAGLGRVLNWNPPERNIIDAGEFLDRQPLPSEPDLVALESRFRSIASTALSRGQNLHDPRYIGHQVPPPSPIAALFDALGTVTNQVMAVYEMGPWSTAVERALIARWGETLGLPDGSFSGLVTSGGSLANLTALLTARNVVLKDTWESGLSVRVDKPMLVVHSDAHYGIARSAGILGLGTNQVVKAPLDDRRRMDPDRLDDLLSALKREGKTVMAVVSCVCATPTGAFDRLHSIADICERHHVWLHVDAAHGGGVIFSETHRHLLNGLARADSFICDAHKMLFVPALSAFVFYKHAPHRFEAFRQEAPYLFDPAAPGAAEYDCGLSTIECTKRAAAFSLWGVWSMFGPTMFGDLVDVTFATARSLYEKLNAAEDFVTLHEPQGNIVVFRFVPDSLKAAPVSKIGDFNRELRRRLIHSGRFYITQTSLEGAGALRCTAMNPLTNDSHLDGLIDAIRETARQM
jgi:L-2,4-diaminobutyrate decarboxylase